MLGVHWHRLIYESHRRMLGFPHCGQVVVQSHRDGEGREDEEGRRGCGKEVKSGGRIRLSGLGMHRFGDTGQMHSVSLDGVQTRQSCSMLP